MVKKVFYNSQINILKHSENDSNTIKYQLGAKNDLFEEYNYDDGKWGVSAILTHNCLTLKCSKGNKNGLFEILQTASEFSGGELSQSITYDMRSAVAKFDPYRPLVVIIYIKKSKLNWGGIYKNI